ncbi:hypothetical protein Acsp01_32560 [Actinoplanes sp. NBRC 101535]|nr:hypothetical protein Acsp01_32560 [Actinoplanes sp. NBRC 101535]
MISQPSEMRDGVVVRGAAGVPAAGDGVLTRTPEEVDGEGAAPDAPDHDRAGVAGARASGSVPHPAASAATATTATVGVRIS